MCNCKKCGKEFIPQKGFLNFCSQKCRNSRGERTENFKEQVSKKLKNRFYYVHITTENLCEYGCGQKANYILQNKKLCCETHTNKCKITKKKNSEKIKELYKKGRIPKGFTTTGENDYLKKSHESRRENLKSQPFENWSSNLRKKEVLKEQEEKCLICGILDWNNKKIIFELDHIDGNHFNNKRENLRCLCPNCHSQTETFRGRNINTGKKKVSDEQLIEEFIKTKSIQKTLINCKLVTTGNRKRLKRIIEKYKLSAEDKQ